MTLMQPIWLLLAIPLGVALWRWRAPTRLLQALRLLVMALVLLAMARPTLWLPDRAGVVVVVADRSRSMPGDAAAQQAETLALLLASKAPRDRLAVVSFGQRVAVERTPDVGAFTGFVHDVGPDGSNLADALARAAALVEESTPARLLVLSDGAWTGRDPMEEAGRAAARSLPIDYRRLAQPAAGDVAIDRFETPLRSQPGEAFMLHAWVRSPVPQEAHYELYRNDTRIAAGVHALDAGQSRLTFRDRAGDPGTARYRLVIRPSGEDPVPGNNTARALVGIAGPRPLLALTPHGDSGLVRLLQAGGLNVEETIGDGRDWSLETLSGYAGVLLENVPAQRIGQPGMQSLAAWIEGSEAGLFITGGQQSFGPGGYFKSPLDPLLPVSMELRREHRKLSVAIVVVLDRSGSMAAPVAGGRTKMDLANLGTTQVLDLLSPMDELGVIAVDSQAHVIADLQPVAENKGPLRGQILRIDSMGGGIFVYEGLAAAAGMLADAEAQTRHIILFADAADAEQPGQYQALLEHCAQANITVSVIGLGTPADSDADLLRDIAARGNGRSFFTTDPHQLPQLFAQDTFVVARSSFITDSTPVTLTAGLATLVGHPMSEPPSVGGYNLTYLRENAMLAGMTQDEYHAPLIAAWQAGLGRVAAYTGEADGEHVGPIADWHEVGELLTSLGRWTIGDAHGLPEGMLLTQAIDRGLYTIRLHLDPQHAAELLAGLPRVTTLRASNDGVPAQREQAFMQWETPDTLRLTLSLTGEETALSTVQIPNHGTYTLTPVCLPYSPELRPTDSDAARQTLRQLARATGGQERLDLSAIWRDLPRLPQPIVIAPALLLLAVVVLLLEVLERRTGVLAVLGRFHPHGLRRRKSAAEPGPTLVREPAAARTPRASRHQPAVPAPPSSSKASAPRAVEPEQGGILDALAHARSRAESRTRRSRRQDSP